MPVPNVAIAGAGPMHRLKSLLAAACRPALVSRAGVACCARRCACSRGRSPMPDAEILFNLARTQAMPAAICTKQAAAPRRGPAGVRIRPPRVRRRSLLALGERSRVASSSGTRAPSRWPAIGKFNSGRALPANTLCSAVAGGPVAPRPYVPTRTARQPCVCRWRLPQSLLRPPKCARSTRAPTRELGPPKRCRPSSPTTRGRRACWLLRGRRATTRWLRFGRRPRRGRAFLKQRLLKRRRTLAPAAWCPAGRFGPLRPQPPTKSPWRATRPSRPSWPLRAWQAFALRRRRWQLTLSRAAFACATSPGGTA